jgi:hypothetical protein
MTATIDSTDDVVALATGFSSRPDRFFKVVEAHDCDGCGQSTPDVDLYAEHSETGEQIWLCMSCGE